jgi:hypothetical protein
VGIGRKIVEVTARVVRETAMGDGPICGVSDYKGGSCKRKKRPGHATCGSMECETNNGIAGGWIRD